MRLDNLLSPRSVAVVGASPRADSSGLRVLDNLAAMGFPGTVYPVNPRYAEVRALRCYPSLSALPEVPDAAFLAVPAEQGPALMEEAARLGLGAVVMNASGYADGDERGKALQDRVAAIAHEADIAVCGPNNTGFVNFFDRVALWTAPHARARPGPVSVISQSGSVAMVLSQDDRALGLGYVMTPGNEAVLTASDYLAHIVGDERVRVVMAFLETVRDPVLFARAAALAWERGKRIVAVKIGRTESGRAAVAAHTGSLAGEEAVYDAFFRRHGIICASDIREMIEVAALLIAYPDPPPTPHVAPLTLSGGEAGLVADLAGELGVSLPPLAPQTVERLRPAFPPFATPRNPLDGWGLGFTPERFRGMIEALLADPVIGVVLLAVDAPSSGGLNVAQAGEMAKVCAEFAPRTLKRFVFANNIDVMPVDPGVRAQLAAAGIPFLSGMREALGAIGSWTRLTRKSAAAGIAARAVGGAIPSSELEVHARLRQAGIPLVESVVVRSPAEVRAAAGRLGYPVVMKGTAASLPHKTELGLVKLGLGGDDAALAAYEDLSTTLGRHAATDPMATVVVQPAVGPGIELVIAARNHEGFGTLVVVGLGGTLVELTGEVASELGPLDVLEAAALIGRTRAARLLAGFRGSGPFDIAAAAGAVAALSSFAVSHPQIRSIEINPLIVLPQGRGAVGVDLVLEQ